MARHEEDGGRDGPRAVLLDAFGTLVSFEPPAPRLRDELRARLAVDIPPEAAEAAMRAEVAHYRTHHHLGVDERGVGELRLACGGIVRDALGLAAPIEKVTAALLAAIRFRVFPEVPAALRALRARGARLAVVSNWDASLSGVLCGLDLLGSFDAVLASAPEGVAKPDPEIFARALARVGVRPEEALHVGDSVAHDVAGARAAGIPAVLLARDGGSSAGVTTVRSLDELLLLPSQDLHGEPSPSRGRPGPRAAAGG